MKISTHLLFERGSSQMSNVQSQLTQSQAQLAQGKQIINASDAPNQAATIQRLKSILSRQDSYQSSLNTIKARLQGEDSTLQNVSDLLVRAKEVAVQGANDTLNAGAPQLIAIGGRPLPGRKPKSRMRFAASTATSGARPFPVLPASPVFRSGFIWPPCSSAPKPFT